MKAVRNGTELIHNKTGPDFGKVGKFKFKYVLKEIKNNFQINTVYSDLLSKVHYQSIAKSEYISRRGPPIYLEIISYLFQLANKNVYKLLFILFIIKLYA